MKTVNMSKSHWSLPTCVLQQSSVLFGVFCLVQQQQQQLKVSGRNVSTQENQLRKV